MNPDTIGFMCTGESDLNTQCVDGEISKSAKKKLRIQRYPDTSGRGLIEGFTVAEDILVVGQTRKIYSECMGKIVILMLDNSRKFDILQFL